MADDGRWDDGCDPEGDADGDDGDRDSSSDESLRADSTPRDGDRSSTIGDDGERTLHRNDDAPESSSYSRTERLGIEPPSAARSEAPRVEFQAQDPTDSIGSGNDGDLLEGDEDRISVRTPVQAHWGEDNGDISDDNASLAAAGFSLHDLSVVIRGPDKHGRYGNDDGDDGSDGGWRVGGRPPPWSYDRDEFSDSTSSSCTDMSSLSSPTACEAPRQPQISVPTDSIRSGSGSDRLENNDGRNERPLVREGDDADGDDDGDALRGECGERSEGFTSRKEPRAEEDAGSLAPRDNDGGDDVFVGTSYFPMDMSDFSHPDAAWEVPPNLLIPVLTDSIHSMDDSDCDPPGTGLPPRRPVR